MKTPALIRAGRHIGKGIFGSSVGVEVLTELDPELVPGPLGLDPDIELHGLLVCNAEFPDIVDGVSSVP
jgi:hypothetical protein